MIDLKNIAGFGIAGNFADHLEQAGESADFVNVKVEAADAPKGIFPFYLPGFDGYQGVYPLSSDTIVLSEGENLQMEPEIALLCDVTYTGERVSALTPTAFAAYNDCSIRRPGAKKISEKKNWGKETKGVSETFIPIDSFSKGGILDHYHIASFIKRDGELIAYGQDSEALGYSYFYEKLITWMVGKFATQEDHGPLEAIGEYLVTIGKPTQFLISIGATRYTEFGETHFLQEGDELFIVVYDSRYEDNATVTQKLASGDTLHKSASLLHQKVVKA